MSTDVKKINVWNAGRQKVNPWAGRRKREVIGSNGILQNVFLNNSVGHGDTAELRKAIAASARASKKELEDGRSIMLTRPFQASNRAYKGNDRAFIPTDEVMARLAEAHNTLNTFNPGSVGKLILDLHLLGFRLFSKASLAGSFLANDAIRDDDKRLVSSIKKTNLELPGLSISSLYDSLTSSIRGKGEQTEAETLATRFFMGFIATRTPNEKDRTTKEYNFCLDLAGVLVEHYQTYSELTKGIVDSFHILAKTFIKHGLENPVPGLIKLSEALIREGDLKYCTVAFDHRATAYPLDIKPEVALMTLAAKYAKEAEQQGANTVNYAKEAITTSNANGLGWLLNKGLSSLAVATDKELMATVGVERDSTAFQQLLTSIKSVKTPELFDDYSLSDIRTDIQGKIDSFIAIHLNRLESSEKEFAELIPKIADWVQSVGQHSDLIKDTGAYNKSAVAKLPGLIQEAHQAALILLGKHHSDLSIESIQSAINSYRKAMKMIDYLVGVTGQINGVIKRSGNLSLIEIPKETKRIVALPVFVDSVINPAHDREHSLYELEALYSELNETINVLTSEYELSYMKSLANREMFFAELVDGKHRTIKTPSEFAFRDLLARLTKLAYSGSGDFRKKVIDSLWKAGIFADKKELVEHIGNRQHYVFVNPLDTKPKKLLRLTDKRPDLEELILTLLTTVPAHSREYIHLTMLHNSILLMGLPDDVLTKLLPKETLELSGDSRFVSLLEEDSISRLAVQALITSAYRSRISGLLYRLNKIEFTHTQTFSPYVGAQLVYVPKDTVWAVPMQMFEGRYANLLSSELMAWQDDRKMNVVATAKNLSSDKDFALADKLGLLKDMPHSYAFKAQVKDMGMNELAIVIEPGGMKRATNISGLIPIMLPRNNRPAIKAIDAWMTGSKVSPPQIQFQTGYRVEDGKVVEEKDQRKILFKMPVTETSQAKEEQDRNTLKIIGIDPGEYGFGVALTELDGTVIDSGFISVNSMINHVKRKKEHRQVTTPRQEYKARYSNHLQQSAKAAVGDIAHILDRLLYNFGGIIVFEGQGERGFDGSEVWDSILSLYSFSDNDTQNAERVSHWFGAKFWDYPQISRKLPSETKHKPFIGFPGTRVGSAGNSQRCSCCGRNPIDATRAQLTNNNLVVIQGGELYVNDGKLVLLNPDPLTATERRRKGLAPEWVQVGDKSFSGVGPNSKEGREALTIVRRSIRRAPLHRKTTQGIDSIYHCAYADCGHIGNAEANSAINVAQKFAEQIQAVS